MKHLISQLAHVEILTPRPNETLWYFRVSPAYARLEACHLAPIRIPLRGVMVGRVVARNLLYLWHSSC